MPAQLKVFFPQTTVAKPKSSRNSSVGAYAECSPDDDRVCTDVDTDACCLRAEAFVVCEQYTPPEGFQPSQLQQLLQRAAQRCSDEEQTAATRLLMPFLACGDLSGAIAVMLAVQQQVLRQASVLQSMLERYVCPMSCHCAGWDADQSYDLPEGEHPYECLPPVQLPTAPAYKSALMEAQRGYMYRSAS